MSNQPTDRQGLDAAFQAEEARKTRLILEGRLLNAQQQFDGAARRFAEAAEIEDRLADTCAQLGKKDNSWKHRFSSASLWALAGNFHQAICMGEKLLAEPDLFPPLRKQIQEYTQALQQRRIQWAAGLELAANATETGSPGPA